MPERFRPMDFDRWLRQRRTRRAVRGTGQPVGKDNRDFYDPDGTKIVYNDRLYVGCLTIVVLLILLVIITIFAVCDPFGGGDGDLIGSPTVSITTGPTGGSSSSTSSTTTTTTKPASPFPDPLDRLLDPLDLDPAKIRQRILDDLIDDLIDSVSSNHPGYTGGDIDIIRALLYAAAISQNSVDLGFNNSIYECGAAAPTVLCAADTLDMPAGEMLIVAVQHAAPVPVDSTERSYIYSLVLESDGDPSNDWVFNPPYDWDLFRGTDRWYQAIYSHTDGSWIVTVTQVGAGDQLTGPLPSAVRVIIQDDWVIWFVPASEIPDFPGRVRATAFAHDGFYTEATRGADVTGADPTEPPVGIDGE